MADKLPLGTLPLAPSLKKGGGMSPDFPSERSPSLFQGWGWVLKGKLIVVPQRGCSKIKPWCMRIRKIAFFIALITGLGSMALGQGYKANPRYSYYTTETKAEILIVLPEEELGKALKIKIGLNGGIVYQADTTSIDRLLRVFIPINKIETGTYPVLVSLTGTIQTAQARSSLVKLHHKPNGTRIDRLTGKLIVNDMPWFPFGFYCYSPVSPTLAEEEAVKGFNLISPYQLIDPLTIKEREAYMDRCARLGMKVHYQLISIAGGGGVGSARSAGLTGAQKMKRLKEEVLHFKDHPALLAWYLSDEPTGNGVSADSLQKMYDFVHELDPHHPVTIVFDAPRRAREYAGAMDIVMADPYPIPNSGVDGVGSVTESLQKVFEYEKPVWIVPQAFGGGEWWGREPSPQEIRAMTYLAIVRGATGIQYFIRQGLNGFPKSTVAWGECSKVAIEVAEMTPYLLDGKPVPEIMKENGGIWTNGWSLNNEHLIVVVNSNNEPRQFVVILPENIKDTLAEVVFENRNLKVEGNRIKDLIGPLGAQIYRLGAAEGFSKKKNLISDPGFESNLSYGVPASCYARVGDDRGATAFLDSRTKVSGRHSLRLITPTAKQGMGLSFFPASLNSGQSYRFSIFSKTDTLSRMPGKTLTFWQKLMGKKLIETRDFQVRIGDMVNRSFTPISEWMPYTFYFTVPENSSGQVKVNPYLELAGQGTAWFDDMTLTADPVISYRFNPEKRKPEFIMETGTPNAVIRYNVQGKKPQLSDPEYTGPVAVSKTTTVTAGIFCHNQLLAWTLQTFKVHLAVGHAPQYEKKYSPQYTAGGPSGLVDGQSGTRNYADGKWQGFNGKDLSAIIDLDSIETVRKVSLGFLQDIASWIFMPLKVEVEGSIDGKNFQLLGKVDNQVDERTRGSIRKDFNIEFNQQSIRYIRVRATNRKVCPDWHNGKGMAAYIFVDEISIE